MLYYIPEYDAENDAAELGYREPVCETDSFDYARIAAYDMSRRAYEYLVTENDAHESGRW